MRPVIINGQMLVGKRWRTLTDAERIAEENRAQCDMAEGRRVCGIASRDPMGVAVSCGKCGHVGGMSEWITTRLGTALPRGTMQCPKCAFAFQRKLQGSLIVLEPIQSEL